ncbi:MAG: YjbQ family protein, partial [Opitutae bacterium]|nr:YjbQ family protein [Opitutae bacterium]
PFANGRLLLGTWQGIFLWEHRVAPHSRKITLTCVGE